MRCPQVDELPAALNEAFRIATSGRPGPVLIDLPKDVCVNKLQHSISVAEPPASPRPHAENDALAKAADIINKAKKPLVLAGHGVKTAEASAVLREFVAKANIPVTTTLLALGTVDSRSPLALGMAGMHGSAASNYALQQADCIISIGARFDDRVCGNYSRFAPEAKKAAKNGTGGIIHFDILPRNINKIVKVQNAWHLISWGPVSAGGSWCSNLTCYRRTAMACWATAAPTCHSCCP